MRTAIPNLSQSFLIIFFFSYTFSSFGQNVSIGPNQFVDETMPMLQSEISLEEWNKALIAGGLNPITSDHPIVTDSNTVILHYEGFKPESEGETDHAMVPKLIKDRGYDFPLIDLASPPPVLPVTTIPGISFIEDATLSGFFHIPADPSGAVGTTHICHVVNTSIDCDTKAGATAAGFPQELEDFFMSLTPENDSFDPKILWDQYENRFVAITLIQTAISDGDAADISRLLLAVSATADPTGTWYFQAINVSQTISMNDCWFDYPGFAVDDQAVYVSGNYFLFSGPGSCGSSQVVIIDKGVSGGIYAGTTSANEDPATNPDFDIYDPVALSTATFHVTIQPAHTFGTPPATMGTWLCGYSGITGGGVEALQIFRINNPLSSPTFTHQFVSMGDIEPVAGGISDAPQSGSATDIEVNDRRCLSAVWRNNKLWATFQIEPNTGANNGQTTAMAAELNASGSGATFDAAYELGGEDISTGATTFFPSISVDTNNDAYVGLSISNSDIFVGSYAVGINGTTGVISSTLTAQAGTDDYVRTFGGSQNRWGDYSNTRLDPSDGSIWTINKIAITNGNAFGGEDGQWQAYMVNFAPSEFILPVDLLRFDALADGNDALLRWSTASEIENKGFEIEHMQNGAFRNIGFVEGAGDSFAQIDYEFNVPDLLPGQQTFRLKQIDYDNSSEYSPIASVLIKTEDVYHLGEPTPNVFKYHTEFDLMVGSTQNVEVSVFDIYGRKLGEIYNGLISEDEMNRFSLDNTSLTQGYYLIAVEGEYFKETKRVLYLQN